MMRGGVRMGRLADGSVYFGMNGLGDDSSLVYSAPPGFVGPISPDVSGGLPVVYPASQSQVASLQDQLNAMAYPLATGTVMPAPTPNMSMLVPGVSNSELLIAGVGILALIIFRGSGRR
jgi:hypothetical protein